MSIIKHNAEGESLGAVDGVSNDQGEMLKDCRILFGVDRTFSLPDGWVLPADVLKYRQADWRITIRGDINRIYRGEISLTNPADEAYIDSDKVKKTVKNLYSSDPHKFFVTLEDEAWWYLIDVHHRLLELRQLCGFNSTEGAIMFVQMLLDEYSHFCNSLQSLLYLLEPLEEYDYDLGVQVERMNKNKFYKMMLDDGYLPHALAKLRLASLSSDHNHGTTAANLLKRYSALCPDEVSRIWEVSKDHLNQQQDAHRKLMERSGQTTADGDSFMQQQTGSGQRKELGVLATQAQTKEEERKMSYDKQSTATGNVFNVKSSFSNEKPAVGFTGEKSGGDGGPDDSEEKSSLMWSEVKSDRNGGLAYSRGKGWFKQLLLWIALSAFFAQASCQEQQLTSTLHEERVACLGEEVIFTCIVRNFSLTGIVLGWSSDEYIGHCHLLQLTSGMMPGANRMCEIDGNVSAIATLTNNSNVAGVPVLESELLITATLASSITCLATDGLMMSITFSISAVPGVPQRINATQLSNNKCTVLVTWDPPANSNGSDIDHYIVRVPSRNVPNVIVTSTLTDLTVPDCIGDTFIQVAAANQFGCIGPNGEKKLTLSNMLLPTTSEDEPTTTTAEDESSTTTKVKPSTESDIGTIVGGAVGGGVSLIIIIIIAVVIVCKKYSAFVTRCTQRVRESPATHYRDNDSPSLTNGLQKHTRVEIDAPCPYT